MKNIVILISGRGSNMQAIVNAAIPDARIAAVLSNSATAAGLAWAADVYQPDLVVLAGFMRILTPEFCAHYQNRLINIHPSILPSFTGLHTHERALEAGCRVAGCTIHFVTPELDCGPIISQGIVPILDGDTPDDIAARVLTVEHRLFPQAVADFVAGRLKIEGNRVFNSERNAEGQTLLA